MQALVKTIRVNLYHPLYTQLLGATLSKFALKDDNILLLGLLKYFFNWLH